MCAILLLGAWGRGRVCLALCDPCARFPRIMNDDDRRGGQREKRNERVANPPPHTKNLSPLTASTKRPGAFLVPPQKAQVRSPVSPFLTSPMPCRDVAPCPGWGLAWRESSCTPLLGAFAKGRTAKGKRAARRGACKKKKKQVARAGGLLLWPSSAVARRSLWHVTPTPTVSCGGGGGRTLEKEALAPPHEVSPHSSPQPFSSKAPLPI